MFNFEHSQITQNHFKKLADLQSKNPTVYARYKFDVKKPIHQNVYP